ncbi:MAG: hypothetical protein ED555_04575 [Allomuricauda sp.]|nr:MAG: hypothetical protein ED555_04575 [Allomuricauda sp.]
MKYPSTKRPYKRSGKGVQNLYRITRNKKGGVCSTFFAPNLTMNLTYLCYGSTKNKRRVLVKRQKDGKTPFLSMKGKFFGLKGIF